MLTICQLLNHEEFEEPYDKKIITCYSNSVQQQDGRQQLFFSLKTMNVLDEDFQRFRAMMMPDVQKLIQQSIQQVQQRIVIANNRNRAECRDQITQRIDQEKHEKDRSMNLIKRDIQNIKNQLRDIRISKNSDELKKSVQLLRHDFQGSREVLNQKLQDLIEKHDKIKNNKIKEINSSIEIAKIRQQRNIDQSLVDSGSANIQDYKIKGRNLQKKNGKQEWSQLLGKFSHINNKINTFTVTSSFFGRLCFGIISQKYIGDKNSFYSPDFICYDGKNGVIWEGGKQMKKGLRKIKSGDKIQMTVKNNKIEWKIEDTLLTYENIPKCEFVPFIMMYDNGDKLQWN